MKFAQSLNALSRLFDPFDRDDRPGLIVGIAQYGRTIYRRACGMANMQHHVANSFATRMELGSITKPFTAILCLRLAERGVINLDEELERWLPELPRLQGSPTLRQLLEHRGGYRDYLDSTFAEGFVVRPGDAAMEFHGRARTVNFSPGAAQLYSNSGYALVTRALERAGGRSYAQLLRAEVLDPLGLHATTPLGADWPIAHDVATCHVALQNGGYRAGVSIVEERLGDGCLVADVSDVLTWLEAIRQRSSLLSPKSWEALSIVRGAAQGSEYSLGLRVRPYRGTLTWSHGGGVMGGTAYALTLPEHGLDIALLANTSVPLERLAHQAVDAILSDALEPAAAEVAIDDWSECVGMYSDARQGSLLQLGEQAGRLTVSEFAAQGPAVHPWLGDEGAALISSPVGTTRISLPSLERGGGLSAVRAGQAIRYEMVTEGSAERARSPTEVTGVYRSEELQTTLCVGLEQEQLVVHCRGAHGWNRLRLNSVAPGIFAVSHDLMPQAAVFRFCADSELGNAALEYSSHRTWRLRFERESRS